MSNTPPRKAAPGLTLFRREAIEHRNARGPHTALLQIDTESASWGFRLLVAGMLVTLAFVCFGRVNEYATGPAFVRVEQHLTLTAGFSTLVSEVDVAPGDVVEAGAVLVRFRAASEDAELQAASREFDDQLAKLLQKPDDRSARDALVALRARRELARAQVEQRTLRAPRRGTVGDVRVRPGQMVEAGASLVELQQPGSEATVVALLPGRYRPLIHPGSTLRFEIDGFHRRAYELPVDTVGDQIVGPTEAARYVGRDSADAFALTGPVVLVQARVHSARFDADGESFGFASGMYGKAETVVRNESLAYAFLPALKPWVERMHPSSWFGGRHG
jgi:membrane fusion protein (multidrug efflux system)